MFSEIFSHKKPCVILTQDMGGTAGAMYTMLFGVCGAPRAARVYAPPPGSCGPGGNTRALKFFFGFRRTRGAPMGSWLFFSLCNRRADTDIYLYPRLPAAENSPLTVIRSLATRGAVIHFAVESSPAQASLSRPGRVYCSL